VTYLGYRHQYSRTDEDVNGLYEFYRTTPFAIVRVVDLRYGGEARSFAASTGSPMV